MHRPDEQLHFTATHEYNVLTVVMFIVAAARYAETHRSLCFVGHAFNEINDVRQQVSRRQVVRKV